MNNSVCPSMAKLITVPNLRSQSRKPIWYMSGIVLYVDSMGLSYPVHVSLPLSTLDSDLTFPRSEE